MSLNLIEDAWIPVICADGRRRIIAPWQMAEPDIVGPDWPRPDLNIACYELLVGLVCLADPPAHITEWRARQHGDPERLRAKLAPFAPAFNLIGDGPLFMQDAEPLLDAEERSVQTMFLDGGGEGGNMFARKDRYSSLSLPMAAMVLYLLQTQAPEGGRGILTSLRGGGPLVSLVDPGDDLWSLVWANVPYGSPSAIDALPWMQAKAKTPVTTYYPADGDYDAEVFFGLPRRIRLVASEDGGRIVSLRQRPHGRRYEMWKHPATPYARKSAAEAWFPVRGARAIGFGYRNWLGVVAEPEDSATAERALTLRNWKERGGGANVLIAGWAMKNAKAREFTFSRQPLLELPIELEIRLIGLIEAAEIAGIALRGALAPVLAEGEVREAEREEFFRATEARFLEHAAVLQMGGEPEQAWLADLRKQALGQFDALALPQLNQRDVEDARKIVEARKFLNMALSGYGKQGQALFTTLGIDVPVVKKRKAA